MATILNIETATSSCSVAIAKDGVVIASEETTEGLAHAEKITLFIRNLIERVSIPLSALDAIAIGTGPGSYTGLRIGTANAKGLCYALDKPLIAVPTLKAMALGTAKKLNHTDALYCPMIDARRLEVYTALFDYSGKEILPVHARILDENTFAELLLTPFPSLSNREGGIAFFGDGMPKMRAIPVRTGMGRHELPEHDNPEVEGSSYFSGKIWIDGIYASALNMCNIAEEMYHAKTFSNVAYYEPFYLKDFVAGKKATG